MKALRAGLFCLLAFSVAAFGAVEVWSASVLEIGAALLLVFWAILVYWDPAIKVYWSPLDWPLLGILAVGTLQLLFHGTAYPFLTRVELLKLAAYCIIFFLTTQAFRGRAALSGLAWFLMLLCFAVSLQGIIQHFTFDGKIYWFRELTHGGDPFGPYVNRNHFAGFIELTLPVSLALIVFRAVPPDQTLMTTLLAIVPVSALILSGSRGGIIAFLCQLGILALLARRRRRSETPRISAIAIVAFAALALIAWIGVGRTLERFTPQHSNGISLTRRVSMFRGAAHIFFDHPVKGSGLGTLVSVFPRYETQYDARVVDHAHNDYIELLADEGLLGGLCGFAFLWLLLRVARENFRAEQSRFSRALHASAIVAVSGLLLHSFADYNLHIPSNALLFLLQAALVASPPLPSERESSRAR